MTVEHRVDETTGLWVAIRSSAPPTPGVDAGGAALPAELDGVVAVGAATLAWATLTVPADASAADGPCLAAALRALPPTASGLAWCTSHAEVTAIGALWRQIGTCDAVMAATPVTDAVKQVRDGRIRRGLDRDGLCVPTPPVVVRVPPPWRLLAALDAGHDPIAAIAEAHLAVGIVQRAHPAPDTRLSKRAR